MSLSLIFEFLVFVLSQRVYQMDGVYCTKTMQTESGKLSIWGKQQIYYDAEYSSTSSPWSTPSIVLLHVGNTTHLAHELSKTNREINCKK